MTQADITHELIIIQTQVWILALPHITVYWRSQFLSLDHSYSFLIHKRNNNKLLWGLYDTIYVKEFLNYWVLHKIHSLFEGIFLFKKSRTKFISGAWNSYRLSKKLKVCNSTLHINILNTRIKSEIRHAWYTLICLRTWIVNILIAITFVF